MSPKPWMLDKVHVVNNAGIYRAHPPTKVAQQKQDICWDGLGKVLEFAPNPSLENYRYNDPRTQVTATVVGAIGTYFEYMLKCEGQIVEGNSPPVVIISE